MTTTLKAPSGADAAIKTAVPLAIIVAAAFAIGIEPTSWMCIVMAAAASSLETVVTHFTLAPRREDYSKRKAMGSYYNHLASISALSAALAVGIVYAVWP